MQARRSSIWYTCYTRAKTQKAEHAKSKGNRWQEKAGRQKQVACSNKVQRKKQWQHAKAVRASGSRQQQKEAVKEQ